MERGGEDGPVWDVGRSSLFSVHMCFYLETSCSLSFLGILIRSQTQMGQPYLAQVSTYRARSEQSYQVPGSEPLPDTWLHTASYFPLVRSPFGLSTALAGALFVDICVPEVGMLA